MKYDDASWHSGGEFPPDLAPESGATHIAMFLAWAFARGQAGDIHLEDPDSKADVDRVNQRTLDARDFFLRWCDGKLTDEDLSDVANEFASTYYGERYYDDLGKTFTEFTDLYRVPNEWPNYDRIWVVLDRRFTEW